MRGEGSMGQHEISKILVLALPLTYHEVLGK